MKLFNFFINPEDLAELKRRARKERISAAAYIRRKLFKGDNLFFQSKKLGKPIEDKNEKK